MQAITDRPGVSAIAVRPLATPEPLAATSDAATDGLRFARGAMIGTIIALFPWSLVILLIGWLL
jgi:hypothetical protein